MTRHLRSLLKVQDVDLAILTVVVAICLYGVTAMHTAEAGSTVTQRSSEAPVVSGAVEQIASATTSGHASAYQIKEEFDFATSRPTLVVLEVPASIGSTP